MYIIEHAETNILKFVCREENYNWFTQVLITLSQPELVYHKNAKRIVHHKQDIKLVGGENNHIKLDKMKPHYGSYCTYL
jgi:hypothetical protein